MYIAGNGDFAEDIGSLEWTTTPPTVEGYYWVTKRRGGIAVVQVVKGLKGRLVVDNGEYEEEFQDWQAWLGPLPEPEPPTE